jgi:hypothetical protein
VTAAIPTTEPAELRAGDTWKWTRTVDDYPAGTWTLKYRFKSPSGGFEIVASASGTDYSVTVSAATSAGYAAGLYEWSAWVEQGDEKYTVDGGTCNVLPNLRAGDAVAALDTRSHARKTLDAIEAVIENRATLDQMSYSIAGRALSRTPLADLLKFKSHYQAEVRAEDNAAKIKNGLGVGGRIQFRT